ncbi:nuclear transport factor 2 family protein [Spirosoma fluviale]|uniref:SnoaL-like domain-containing protein n=1 Tax=Spirosoma fluviale TaxID=1597977 RepID=A0A286G8I3_9BACT|nr:nuclear transport factor 2 family protein [Spirosoma fluviale]SOD91853.1 SnoaL-like domain-containing protein [Spirosoma fluviale]
MQEIIRAYIQAYNDNDIPAMLVLLDDHIIFENVSNTTGVTTTTSKQAFEQLAIQSVSYFAERKQIIRFMVMGTDSAAVEIDYQAVLAQDLPNELKAGDQLNLRGVSFFEIQNRKIIRISDYS